MITNVPQVDTIFKCALILNVPTLRKRNLHRNTRGGGGAVEEENRKSPLLVSNFGLSYLFESCTFLGLLDFLRKPASAKIRKLAYVANKDLQFKKY